MCSGDTPLTINKQSNRCTGYAPFGVHCTIISYDRASLTAKDRDLQRANSPRWNRV